MDTARVVALAHLEAQSTSARNGAALAPSRWSVHISGVRVLRDFRGRELAYIADLAPSGFIAVSADTDIRPVIAYSFNGQFSMIDTGQNTLLHILRQDMRNRLDALATTPEHAKMENNILWEQYLDNDLAQGAEQWPPNKDTGWLDTSWSQRDFYNDSCPDDPNTDPGYRYDENDNFTGGTEDGRCMTGCTATGMAQIVNYWQYPAGILFTSDDNYTSSLDPGDGFGERIIQISASEASIPDIDYNDGNPSESTIADLLFACGITLKANYSDFETPASLSVEAYYRLGYASAIMILGDDESFYQILRHDMKNARPAQLSICKGDECESPHAIVADGYRIDDTGEYYHLNFGWGSGQPDPITECWYSLPDRMGDGYNVITLGILGISPSFGPPMDWYVSPDGSDYNDGNSWATAKRTIGVAINLAQPGDVIRVAAGTYYGRMRFRTGITLLGEGAENTRIEFSGDGSVLQANQVRSGEISGLTIAYTGTDEHPTVWLENSSIIITQNVITGSTHSGICVMDASDPQIVENEIRDNRYGGISFYSGSRGTIAGNVISGNGNAGISVTENSTPEIRDNEIRANGQSGISVFSESHCTISGNVISENSHAGITVTGNSDSEIRDNEIKANGQSGISVFSESHCTISGNVISENSHSGITVTGNSDPEIKDNEIKKNEQSGIYVYSEGRGMISGNVISGSGYSGVSITGNSDPQIRNNRIEESKYSGVYVYSGGHGTISGNVISGNGSRGIEVREDSDPEVSYNTIVNNKERGIWVYLDAAPDIRNNIIVRNAVYGVSARGFGGNSDGNPMISFNNVWGNSYGSYEGITKPATDISVDPLFVDMEGGNYHLLPDSPCRGASDEGRDLGAYQEPVIAILSPTAGQVFPAGTESIDLTVSIINYTDSWYWSLGTPFPTDGHEVMTGNTARITGLQNGQTYTVYAALVSESGSLLCLQESATFSVEAGNEPPVVSDIPDQAARSGEAFTAIVLDSCVSDPNDEVSEMLWTCSGSERLAVNISDDRVATIILPNSEWSGSETITFTAADPDGLSDSDSATFTVFPRWDINGDGTVDISDLMLVGDAFGASGAEFRSDVNRDGVVNILDLVTVAMHYGETTNLSAFSAPRAPGSMHTGILEQWLRAAKMAYDGSEPFKRGITVLERLLNSIVPRQTALLQNYPNPFNPDTWIPYQLREASSVHIVIYDATGKVIRQFNLGDQPAGTYRTQATAVRWDGRNESGEQVASGVYFYTIQAGGFTATKKMIVAK